MAVVLTNQVQVGLDFDLDRVDGLDDGVDDNDNLIVANVSRVGLSELVHHGDGGGLDDGGGGGESNAGSGQADDSRDGAGIVDRSGHGGANREGGEGGAEELHCAG